MPVSFSVRVDGVQAIDRVLGDWVRAIDDWTPAWERIADDFAATNRKQFAANGVVDGLEPWTGLADSTKASKARKCPANVNRILVCTGRLEREAGNPQRKLYKQAMTLTIPTPYAIWHQRGTGRMPARPVIRLDDNPRQRERWLKILAKHAEPK
jgi:phage gpG-like protein